jgi:hypothetical protein
MFHLQHAAEQIWAREHLLSDFDQLVQGAASSHCV